MRLRDTLILGILVVQGGCASSSQHDATPATGVGHRSLVVPPPTLFELGGPIDPTAPEFARNDDRLGRIGPVGDTVVDVTATENRQRIQVSGGRARDHSTYRTRSWRLRYR